MSTGRFKFSFAISLIIFIFCCQLVIAHEQTPVDLTFAGSLRFKGVKQHTSQKLAHKVTRRHQKPVKQARINPKRLQKTGQPPVSIMANIIENPPVDGFVPYIAVVTTNAHDINGDLVAIPSLKTGSYTAADPAGSWALAIFDTGASAHVLDYSEASRLGLANSSYLTDNITTITGVTGEADTLVSMPFGLFVSGLDNIGSDNRVIDLNSMIGETNVAVAIGTSADAGFLPSVIGSPLSVYYTACIYNDTIVTVDYDNEPVSGPSIVFYELDDPCTPEMPYWIPLELRPLGSVNVAYIPDLDIEDIFSLIPASPSILNGINPTQSLFFVPSVDLFSGTYSAMDKDRFMIDTGAQVSVIGSRIAARLNININDPAFEVEVQGVNGESLMVPGFYIDEVQIPALGSWISFTNVPVIYLDIYSPEGGTLDGIIGMNLFVDFNLKMQGGGTFLTPDPYLAFEPIAIFADIAPASPDFKVNALDFAKLASHWLQTANDSGFDPVCDLAPETPDGIINFLDFAVLAQYWLEDRNP